MSGMNSGVNVNDPVVIAAFKSALLHQGIIALLIFGLLGLAWITVRAWWPAAVQGDGQTGPGSSPAAAVPEPAWRQVLRVGFGLLWVVDGILQAQPKMAIGLPSQVIQPSAASSPHWVQQVVNWAGTTWSYHPMQAGAAAVWIQVGIGIWMLAAPRGSWSRLAGLAGVGWGLVVWVFGESFGGVFAPGLTWRRCSSWANVAPLGVDSSKPTGLARRWAIRLKRMLSRKLSAAIDPLRRHSRSAP